MSAREKRGTSITGLIRWAGSKRQIVADLLEYWPKETHRYIEPFCGSACLFFEKRPKRAVLGDINSELINAYKTIKRNPLTVWTAFRKTKPTKRNYYSVRKIDPHTLSETKRAARFLFLNRYSFNGLFRTNLRGEFNVPYGGSKQAQLSRARIIDAAGLLRRAKVVQGDFEKTLRYAKCNDFVYLDPPYALESRRIFSEYDKATFATSDLDRLCLELRRLDRIGAWFLLSYADTPATRIQFGEWHSRRIITRRNIAGFAGNRRKAYELLVANFPLRNKKEKK